MEDCAIQSIEAEENFTNTVPLKKKAPFFNRKRSALIFYISMVTVPVIQFILMYICVNFNSILLSFKTYEDGSKYVFSEDLFCNFREVFSDLGKPLFKYSIKNSLLVFVVVLLVNIPLSLFFSYYIFKECIGNKFFRIALYLPNIVSSIVMVTIFSYVFDKAIPDLAYKITGLKKGTGEGWIFKPLLTTPDTTFWCLLIFTTLFSFGSITLVFSSSMSSVNTSVIEAAILDGCNKLQEFIYIIFPLCFNVIKLQLLAALVGIFTNQLNLYTFFGLDARPKQYTIGYYLYRGTLAGGPSVYPYFAAMGLVLTAVAVPVILSIRRVFEHFDPYNS